MYSDYLKFPVKDNKNLMATPSDIEGPFYKENAPELYPDPLHELSCILGHPKISSDKVITIHGFVLGVDANPIENAILDIWQADGQGTYDNTGFNFRGKITTNKFGFFKFITIQPGDYQIGENPPDFRCSHIHFKISANGFKKLTTQLYFLNDKYNATDHWFDAKRVVQIPNGNFDFVLEKE